MDPQVQNTNRQHGWSDYFNSGVICVDVPAWRAADIGATALSLVTKHGLSDQHALNTVVAGRWTALDPRWNVLTHYDAPSARWEYEAWEILKQAAARQRSLRSHLPPGGPRRSSFRRGPPRSRARRDRRPALTVDTNDPTRPYEQLRRQLADLIEYGVLAADDRLALRDVRALGRVGVRPVGAVGGQLAALSHGRAIHRLASR
ncbi:glycosyltransferase [Micromonospora sp. 067-2]|uniref:glycosyltransferase n=1 Tax=Micromonospora sp. 067-2 TaxID=2789270 RepID=UPI00397CD62A